MSKASIPGSLLNNSADALLTLLEGHEDKFPRKLAASFPHVVEQLVALWNKPAQTRAYLSGLMVTDRENRLGFPPAVYSEMLVLTNLYDALNPPPKAAVGDYWGWIFA